MAETCQFCLKNIFDNSITIDDSIERDFYNITQMELSSNDSYSNNVCCELCFHALQFTKSFKNQLVENQRRFLEIINFTAPKIKIENSYDMNDIQFIDENTTNALQDVDEPGTSYRLEEKNKPTVKKRVTCEHCDQTFADNSKLKRHNLRFHQTQLEDGEVKKDFICSECGKCFSSASNLNSHEIFHQEPKFQCEYCSKTFYENSTLRNHINSQHLKHKPYKCTQCPNEYSKQYHLNRHVKRAHMKQSFLCNVEGCGKVFARKEKVKEHIRLKHRVENNEFNSLIKEVYGESEFRQNIKDEEATADVSVPMIE